MKLPTRAQVIPWIDHWIVFFVLTILSQVTIAGQALDLTSATGRAAAVSAILSVVWVAFRKAFASGGV